MNGASGAVTMTVDPFTFLPPGLSLVQSGGEWSLAGTPTAGGQFNFTIRITDGFLTKPITSGSRTM